MKMKSPKECLKGEERTYKHGKNDLNNNQAND